MKKQQHDTVTTPQWARPMLLGALLWLGSRLSAHSADEPAQFPSNEVMRHFRAMHDPALSPDGTKALLSVVDASADGGRSHLWLIDIAGNAPRLLTVSPEADKKGEQSGQWSADGHSIFFLAHRGEHTGLFVIPVDGGEAKSIDIKVHPTVDDSKSKDAIPPAKSGAPLGPEEDLPVDVKSFRPSPDGLWIAFSARDPETPGEKKQQEAKADAQWVDNDTHGTRLYLMRLEDYRVTPVPIPPDVQSYAWRPDSSGLISTIEAVHSAGDLGFASSAWVLEMADTTHPRQITSVPSSVHEVTWSTDGHSIMYTAQARRDAPPGYDDLYVSELGTTLKTYDKTDGLDASLSSDAPIALADGGIVQLMLHGLNAQVAVYPATETHWRYLDLPVPMDTVRTNAARNGWLFLGSSGGHSPALYYASDLVSPVKQLATPSVIPDHTRSVTPKHIQWRHEGLTIEGLLYVPPEAGERAVPLIVEVHGGPTGQYVDRFVPFDDFLVGLGWAVLRINPRGSTGYGAAFAAGNKNDLGGGDYRDIMAGVDYVLKTEHLDPTRIALMGYSYGGEMAGFVEGKTTRFKAIVSGAPVIDQYSEYGTEDSSLYDRWFYGKPWEHVADAWRQSPLAHVGSARTPFMLLQGEADKTDPLSQSQEMYRALRQIGVPVEFITYPRDDHGPLAQALYGAPVNEPWHGFDARRRVVEFIEKAFATTH